MREIFTHVPPVAANDAPAPLVIKVLDEPGQGGAPHLYRIENFDTEHNDSDPFKALYGKSANHATVLFQNGPIKEYGVNGVTHEALLAILIDRLTCFQSGPFPSEENAMALTCLEEAMDHLHTRTVRRVERGVEGTNQA